MIEDWDTLRKHWLWKMGRNENMKGWLTRTHKCVLILSIGGLKGTSPIFIVGLEKRM